jgi:hypothetical protein
MTILRWGVVNSDGEIANSTLVDPPGEVISAGIAANVFPAAPVKRFRGSSDSG